jgi:hypothetical protein
MTESPLVDRLRSAAQVVDDASLPSDLRSAGFVLAFQAQGSHDRSTSASTVASPGAAAESGRVAAKLGVDVETIEEIYDLAGGRVELILPRRVLAPAKTAAVVEIVHLVVAARQLLEVDVEWTPVSAVRDECDHMGVLDGNFGRAIAGVSGNGFRVRGSGKARELKINAAGLETAGAIANRLGGSLG